MDGMNDRANWVDALEDHEMQNLILSLQSFIDKCLIGFVQMRQWCGPPPKTIAKLVWRVVASVRLMLTPSWCLGHQWLWETLRPMFSGLLWWSRFRFDHYDETAMKPFSLRCLCQILRRIRRRLRRLPASLRSEFFDGPLTP